MEPNTCRTFLISDTPSEKDEFGSHQRLADAIVNLISTEEDGGKTMGIEGDWGSGKSTVVNLISTTLLESENNLVFLFDAWAHQDDPLRRTFLESLIVKFEGKGWIDAEIWRKVRAVIASRIKIETKTTHSKLKPWARLFIFSSLLLPLGAALLNSGLANPAANVDFLMLKIVTGTILTLLPGVILMAVVLQNRFKKDKTAKQNDQDDPLTFMFQKSTTDTQTETFQTINPTSIEFENTFSDLMEEALDDISRKIIIVLDNLDRIEADNALSLLATLQTFLQYKGNSPNWLKRLWIIIPYDREGLERLWQIGKKENAANETTVATSFFDKRFQIRFEVPPVVLSDWSAYLTRLLKSAFPDHEESEFHTTYRVYATYRPNINHSPTPRELKLYVNQIGTFHRQWKDTFPLPHIGYYVLQKRSGKNVLQKLLNNEYNEHGLQALLGHNLNDSLVSLAYNAETPIAQQLLLQEPIENALGEGNEERFVELTKLPGAQQILENIPFSEWADDDNLRLANAACIFTGEKGSQATDINTRSSVASEFKRALKNATTWAPFNLQIAAGIAAMFDLTNADIALISKTFGIISSTPIEQTDNQTNKNEVLHSWMESIVSLLDIIQKNNPKATEILSNKVIIPCSASSYLEISGFLHEIDSEAKFWYIFEPSATAKDITAGITTLIQKNTLTQNHARGIQVIKKQSINIVWSECLSELTKRLQILDEVTFETITAQLSTLWSFKEEPKFDTYLTNLAQGGFILHHLHVSARKDHTSVAYCLLTFLHAYPDFKTFNPQGNSESGRSLISQIFKSPDSHQETTEIFIKLLEEHGEYNLPYKILSAPDSNKWISSIVKIATSRPNAIRFFSSGTVLKYWAFIKKSLGNDEFDKLMTKVLNETEILALILEGNFDNAQAGLYAGLTRIGATQDSNFVAWSINGLQQISQENLQVHIFKEDDTAELIVDLVDKDIKIDLGPDFQEILFKHGVALMKGEIQGGYLAQVWDRFFELLKPHAHETLRTRLIDAIKQQDGEVSSGFYDVYGEEIIKTDGIETNPGLVLHLFTPAIKNRNISGLKWIVNLLEKRPSFFSRYSSNSEIKDLGDWIQNALDNEMADDASVLINQISSKLDIVHKKKNKDS